MRSFEDIALAIDTIKIIHESLRELVDLKTFLIHNLSHSIPMSPVLYLIWRFFIIPDTLIVSFRKDPTSLKPSFRDYNVKIPQFIFALKITG